MLLDGTGTTGIRVQRQKKDWSLIAVMQYRLILYVNILFLQLQLYHILLYGYLKVIMNKYSSLFKYVHYPISSISFVNRWTRTTHFHTKANI